ncbi:NAD(P)-dependent oxidoreductase [Mycobacterium pseudokansasii]|uniref:NAD(P)-dependent oxidoreductase n=1 Tax=Mycobacterium pseudokansasii TaxID=2341080 RepID=UPI0023F2BA4B|nr:NAD(P)-dependent oxidoreductase [Mycobacterium pseudokansasii]
MCRRSSTRRAASPKAARSGWRPLPHRLAGGDTTSLHEPLTGDTKQLIDAGALARMRPDSALVSTAPVGQPGQPTHRLLAWKELAQGKANNADRNHP